MFKYSPDRAENVDPELLMSLLPTYTIDVWSTGISAAIEWNAKIFEVVTATQRAWFDFAIRRSAAYMALQQNLGACKSYEDFDMIYADFFHDAVARYDKLFAPDLRPVSTSAKPDGSGQLHGDDDPSNSA